MKFAAHRSCHPFAHPSGCPRGAAGPAQGRRLPLATVAEVPTLANDVLGRGRPNRRVRPGR